MRIKLSLVQSALVCAFVFTVGGPCVAQVDWQPVASAQQPAERAEFAFAYDVTRDRAVLFGGRGTAGAVLGDTWEFDGQSWQRITPLRSPSARSGARMAFDPISSTCLLFGGQDGSGQVLGDTWEWRGQDWVQRSPSTVPPARRDHGMAFDGVNLRVTLFGGGDGGAAEHADTWEWDAVLGDWMRIVASGAPSLRAFAMCSDPASDGVLVYGGVSGQPEVESAETWRFDGVDWTLLRQSSAPGARRAAGMVPDPYRSRVVLFGGVGTSAGTWEWDGVRWLQRAPTASPVSRAGSDGVYDAQRRRILLFGGERGGVALNDSWAYVMTDPASAGAFGSGCAGTAGAVRLAPDGLPWVGDTFGWTANGLQAGNLSVLALGGGSSIAIDLTILGAPGCSILVASFGVVPLRIVSSQASVTGVIGNDPRLLGVHLLTQAWTLDPGANALGVVTSGGVDAVIGMR